MSEKATRYIPRWLHFQANIEADTDGWHFTEIPPNAFANETIWPYRLDYLAITGLPPYATLPGGDSAQFWGGLGTCVNLELGISGASDVNQVTTTAAAIMAHNKRYIKGSISEISRQMFYNDGVLGFKFKHPYMLARGNGFNVQFKNSSDDFQYMKVLDSDLPTYRGTPAFMAHGVGVQSGQPKQFAGTYVDTDDPRVVPTIGGGVALTFSGADLVNDGAEDVLINEITMTYPERLATHTIDSNGLPFLNLCALYSNYQINPINGPKWMPGAEVLPLMGICPREFPWPLTTVNVSVVTRPLLQVPAVYDFPPGATLMRRQRLSVRMNNNAFVAAGINIPIRTNITLFGYLEVR
jgi:hypothetical protein